MDWDNLLKKIIRISFLLLFLIVPLFFTPVNSELFEFNKIILIYAFSVLIIGSWTARMILQKRIIFNKSFLDIPLVLFLLSQVLSFMFSIDKHTSFFGYYSRFNGGLLSSFCYLGLYWAFVTNCEKKDVFKSLKASLLAGAVVGVYGILEHFGHSFSCLLVIGNFGVACWVQKVQERVFATLGQPNWLAAYLAVLIPLSWYSALNLNYELRIKNKKKNSAKFIIPYSLFIILFSCLLFTQSRSGFLGFLVSFGVFWGIVFATNRHQIKSFIKPFLILNSIFLILIVVFGFPFSRIKFFPPANTQPPSPTTSLDGGISESGDIRKIVWKGAIDIFKHYPLFGSGVETFAYSYYQFRPIEHNLVSEWDFLYNKAHNEYLNYLSTTGIFGLGSYLLFICSFLYINLKSIFNFKFLISKKIPNIKPQLGQLEIRSIRILSLALFAGWLSLMVTNFFGFSVVVTSLYFFLIPAFCGVLVKSDKQETGFLAKQKLTSNQKISLAVIGFLVLSFGFKVFGLWQADYYYSQGQKLTKQGMTAESFEKLSQAIKLTPKEPVFLSEISAVTANLAVLAGQQNQATSTSEMVQLAVYYSDKAKKISPVNLNILKTRIKVFYTLSSLIPDYLQKAIETTKEAITLSPTDPKLVYNLGLLYGKAGQSQLAINYVEQSVVMKPNYVDGRNALAMFYEDIGEKQKALDQLELLIKLAPENRENFEEKIRKLML